MRLLGVFVARFLNWFLMKNCFGVNEFDVMLVDGGGI
jgi:hypothetical protein